jgi:Rieske Fe-S protein
VVRVYLILFEDLPHVVNDRCLMDLTGIVRTERQRMDSDLTRRRALGAAAIAGVGAAVAACSPDAEPGTAAGVAQASGAPQAEPKRQAEQLEPAVGLLGKTADIPLNGGVFLGGQDLLVVQPETGVFKAYHAKCTHRGCALKSVTDGAIVCPCHDARFSLADGSVEKGPAKTGLSEVPLKVDGETISLA